MPLPSWASACALPSLSSLSSTSSMASMASPTLLATSSSPPAALPAAVSAAALPKWVVFGTSGLGGVMGWCVVHPFNTLAVRMSLAAAAGKTFRIGDTSLGSLYDGLSAGMLRQVFYATSRFGLFETARDAYAEHYGGVDFGARVVIGAVTGGMAAYISCPMEVAVVRMSNDKTLPLDERRNYKNVFDTASRVIKEEGVSAFWRGSNPFVSRAMMVGIFQVATLDQFKDYYAARFDQVKNSVSNVFCAAMTSGLIYSIATMPLEATKNRMASQKRMPNGQLPYTGILQTLTKISSQEGVLSLFNGFLPYYLRCGGHTVSMFVFIQLMRDAYATSTL